ncbi:Polyisoprenoid-binding protein YceI [Chryseobacterium rhizoplanae]|uniref:Polyisoprenoid-binding protein YceI n=1 Tax=Chryseobacterium rhizoplanae TaxID=1609531 RepID=A0A521D9C3_9FLAO|nr:YceI family protein [Chryseobacterium rhizoplanae]SMO67691.1 Polyisoprenoid-binding protein YceI [Chryseobacterium rhizoplanae]
MDTKNFKVNNEKSTIDWIGRKVTGAHNGTIGVKEGNFTFEDGKPVSGKFIIDTRAIKILDIEDAETNAQFASHLTSDDFFNSDQFPEAVFEITHAEPGDQNLYYVTGDLTIKGITHSINTSLHIVTTDNAAALEAKIVVDRTKFNIKFRSSNFFTNLGDTLIYNNFDLNIHLVAEAN